jgi:hypothetical protein
MQWVFEHKLGLSPADSRYVLYIFVYEYSFCIYINACAVVGRNL